MSVNPIIPKKKKNKKSNKHNVKPVSILKFNYYSNYLISICNL